MIIDLATESQAQKRAHEGHFFFGWGKRGRGLCPKLTSAVRSSLRASEWKLIRLEWTGDTDIRSIDGRKYASAVEER
jgi:hypothetical protein